MQNRTAPPTRAAGFAYPHHKSPELCIRHGLADQLARLSHFVPLTDPQGDELEAVALWLIGPVRDARAAWSEVRPLAEQLWFLISEDWSEEHLDPDCDEDTLVGDRALDARYHRTVSRLSREIEDTIGGARLVWAEIRRARQAAAR